MFPFLENLDANTQSAITTVGGGLLALFITLAIALPITLRARKKSANTNDTPGTDDASDTGDASEKRPLLMPLTAWLALTLGGLLAFLLVFPRERWGDVVWTDDANLRTIHAFGASALAALLAFLPSRFLPAPVAIAWRALLGAGVAVLGVWLLGSFLVTNEIWSPTKFWWIAGIAGVFNALLWALVTQPTAGTEAPALTLLSSAALLAGASAPVFFSKSTVMAHTLGAFGIAFALLGVVSLFIRVLGRSSIAPALALSALLPAILIPAVYAEEMLIATLIPLALAPLALSIHRLPSVQRLPGPALLLPGALQLLALALLLGTSTAFATGLLEVHPEKAPWKGEEAASSEDGAGESDIDYDSYWE